MSANRASLRFDLRLASPFGYTCRRCSRCCHDQRVHLNPYEVLRLARARGRSTGEILASATTESGTVLAFDESGCVFLGKDGCTVHAGRPLACRLYPLGRYIAPDGAISFAVLPGHPASEGVFRLGNALEAGDTVERFVREQGAEPYLRAADAYYVLLVELRDRLAARVALEPEVADAAVPLGSERLADVDEWVTAYAGRHGLPIPEDLDALVELHRKAIGEWACGGAGS